MPLLNGHVHEAVEEVLERNEFLGDILHGDIEVVADLSNCFSDFEERDEPSIY